MLRFIARGITGSLARRLILSATYPDDAPIPSDAPHVHAMGPDPDRVLMLGSAAVSGIGVTSHELGIGGYLARQLSALTGRGVDIDLAGTPGLTAAKALGMLDTLTVTRYDAVVLMLGTQESIGLVPVSQWSRDIRELIGRVLEHAPHVSVFVVGVPSLSKLVPFRRVVGPAVSRQVSQINAATRRVCVEEGTQYISFAPGPLDPDRFMDATTYAVWADPIARHMAIVLDDALPVPHRYGVDEEFRQSALDAMDVLDSPPTVELDAITRVARDLFGVRGAAVNLIDKDRQHMKAVTGVERGDSPRDESFCSLTVDLGGLLVIGDTTRDPRVNELPATIDEGIRFYAGYPVESPNGQRVGTLCLFDDEPRSFTASDASLLRELALRVQRELWRRVAVPLR